jgi:hypothetical protein
VQAVARCAARCLSHVLGRSANTFACGRSFAVLSTPVSTAGLRLWHNRLTCGNILKVSRDAAAVEKNNSPIMQWSRVNIALSLY